MGWEKKEKRNGKWSYGEPRDKERHIRMRMEPVMDCSLAMVSVRGGSYLDLSGDPHVNHCLGPSTWASQKLDGCHGKDEHRGDTEKLLYSRRAARTAELG